MDAADVWLLDFYWHVRNPLLWWGYFLLGWWLRLHEDELRALVAPRRGALRAWRARRRVVALTLLATLERSAARLLARTAIWLDVYAILALVALAASTLRRPCPAGCARSRTPPTRSISTTCSSCSRCRSGCRRRRARSSAAAILLPWLAGLAGSLALVALGRALLGARARDWLGA